MNQYRRVPLLELDAALGRLLSESRREQARTALGARVGRLRKGALDIDGGGGAHVGLLVLDGVVAHEVLLNGQASTELLGPGDVVRPWTEEPGALLRRAVRWSTLVDTRVALLDREFARELGHWPEVNAAIMERLAQRAERLATTQAIFKMTGVDRRILAFLWHLAERWGRMTPDGVLVPLTLSHRMMGDIVGARRPTVTAAVRALVDGGELARLEDGSWLLTGSEHDPGGAREVPRVAPRRGIIVARERLVS